MFDPVSIVMLAAGAIDYTVILAIAGALGLAAVLGYVTNRLGLSPVVGYLAAGLLIGPYTPIPGFATMDLKIAEQLAEVGVILLMFGVGLHFHIRDLVAVRWIAIPGAIGQSTVATLLGLAVAEIFGWSVLDGVVLGMSVSVAGTVMLIRVLTDGNVLHTPAGHAGVGWLVMEDIFSVVAMVLFPAIATAYAVSCGVEVTGSTSLVWGLSKAMLGLLVMSVLLVFVGPRVIPWLLDRVARSRSRELFTLTVLAMALGIAVAGDMFLGVSVALGAFLAGTVVGQSGVSGQAASDAMPMRDAFAVLFFVSVGMLFNPAMFITSPWLLLAILGIILIGKPLAAIVIVMFLGHPVRTGLVVALGLAQIGEFSFMLAYVWKRQMEKYFSGQIQEVWANDIYNMVVAAAMITLSMNPTLFRQVDRCERWLHRRPALWKMLTFRMKDPNKDLGGAAPAGDGPPPIRAIVVGYGPVGRILTRTLSESGIVPTVVETNVKTVTSLKAQGVSAIFGDASRQDILEAAGVADAQYLVLTLPEPKSRFEIISSAKTINPAIRVLARARYLAERQTLDSMGVNAAAYEEAEIAVILADHMLREIGKSEEEITQQAVRVRQELTA
jgi:CPA2 family monovalent cation:H+ antiporter-2